MKKTIIESVRIILIATIFSLGLGVAFAWSGPSSNPTDINVEAPLNVGSDAQTKAGYLALQDGIGVTSIIFPDGTLQTTAGGAGGSGIPVNTITSFNQATCPTGWVLANGENGTPDLRGIFVRGAGISTNYTNAAGAYNTATFGQYQVDSVISHTHTRILAPQPAGSGNGVPQSSEGGQTQRSTSDAAFGGQETRPASYALIYCMKTSEDSVVSNSIFGSSTSNVFVQNITKNFGIGTTNPSVKLDVAGTIKASSYVGVFPDYTNGVSVSLNTAQQASSDGYLSVVAGGSYMNNLQIQVGSTSAVGTLIWMMGDDINNNTKGGSALLPIKKGTWYKILSPGSNWIAQYGYESILANFYPAN